MQLIIDQTSLRPIYAQIVDEFRRLIAVGDLKPEDGLPSVRQLSAELRVNHNTIAQAYRELERDGVVYVRRGQGTFVAARRDGASERARLAAEVAVRALMDAHRHGLDANALVDAIHAQSADVSRGADRKVAR